MDPKVKLDWLDKETRRPMGDIEDQKSEPKRSRPFSRPRFVIEIILKILFSILLALAFMLALWVAAAYAKMGHLSSPIPILGQVSPNDRGFLLLSWIVQSLVVFDVISIVLFESKIDDVPQSYKSTMAERAVAGTS